MSLAQLHPLVTKKVSVIVCTYEPEPVGFARLLAALSRLQPPEQGWEYDVIIVDNNSPTPIAARPETVAFLNANPRARIVCEATPGLTAARRRGIEETAGNWVLFFDDDNEPAVNYLARACELADNYPSVGAWGAGTVNVEYLEALDDPYVDRRRDILHQVNRTHLEYACLRGGWHRCYPAGMGMMLRRDIATRYLSLIDSGQLSAKDRVGRTLSAAGDVQIVFTGIQMGYAAGLDPALCMQHMMGKRKATFLYLKQILYGNARSYAKAYQEAYQEPISYMYMPANAQIAKDLAGRVYKALKNRQRRTFQLELATYIGQVEGNYLACDQEPPSLLVRLRKLLEL